MEKLQSPGDFLNSHHTISHFFDDRTEQMVVPSEQVEQALKEYAAEALRLAAQDLDPLPEAENPDYIKHQDKRYIREDYVRRKLVVGFIRRLLEDGKIEIRPGHPTFFSTYDGEPIDDFKPFIPEFAPKKASELFDSPQVPWVEEKSREFIALQEENNRLQNWVSDLQSGMYVNCVYCGHRYGKTGEVPESMADILKQHIEKCPAHPMSKLKQENEELKAEVEEYSNNLKNAVDVANKNLLAVEKLTLLRLSTKTQREGFISDQHGQMIPIEEYFSKHLNRDDNE